MSAAAIAAMPVARDTGEASRRPPVWGACWQVPGDAGKNACWPLSARAAAQRADSDRAKP